MVPGSGKLVAISRSDFPDSVWEIVCSVNSPDGVWAIDGVDQCWKKARIRRRFSRTNPTSQLRSQIICKRLEQSLAILRSVGTSLFELNDPPPHFAVGGRHHRVIRADGRTPRGIEEIDNIR